MTRNLLEALTVCLHMSYDLTKSHRQGSKPHIVIQHMRPEQIITNPVVCVTCITFIFRRKFLNFRYYDRQTDQSNEILQNQTFLIPRYTCTLVSTKSKCTA